MSPNHTVVIIEDDFRVADINRQFVEKVEGFTVIGVAKTGEEAMQLLAKQSPNLIVMDIYIPDVEGLHLLWEIRQQYKQVDIIMITAAKEVTTIEEALKAGIVDYLIKPIDFERLQYTLERYKQRRELLKDKAEIGQDELDFLLRHNHQSAFKEKEIVLSSEVPKGIDPLTLEKVKQVLHDKKQTGVTAVELGSEIGASRTTARRYLEYLISLGVSKAELTYGEIGRPERRYFSI